MWSNWEYHGFLPHRNICEGAFFLLKNKEIFSRERTKQVEEYVLDDGHPKGQEIEPWLKLNKNNLRKDWDALVAALEGEHKLMRLH